MYRVTVAFNVEDASSKMEVSRIVRAAILSSAVTLRDVEIQAIDFTEDAELIEVAG